MKRITLLAILALISFGSVCLAGEYLGNLSSNRYDRIRSAMLLVQAASMVTVSTTHTANMEANSATRA